MAHDGESGCRTDQQDRSIIDRSLIFLADPINMAWGQAAAASCSRLLDRLEAGQVQELTILSGWTEHDAMRLGQLLADGVFVTAVQASGKPITIEGLRAIGRGVGVNRHLQHLSIGSPTSGDEGLLALLEGFTTTTTLSSLDWSYKDASTVSLAAILRCRSITHINLSRNPRMEPIRLDDDVSQHVVFELDLSDCNVSDASITALTARLQPQVVRLSHNPLTKLPCLPSVKELYLSHCQIESLEGLTALESLQVLDLSHNRLSDASMLVPTDTLRILNLAGNPIADTLPLQQSLFESLDLSQTGCSPAYASRATAHVSHELRLFDNRLGAAGVMALEFSSSSPLQSLDLAGNQCDEATLVALLQRLQTEPILPQLKTLIVGGNQGGPKLEEAVVELKRVRPELDVARDKKKQQTAI